MLSPFVREFDGERIWFPFRLLGGQVASLHCDRESGCDGDFRGLGGNRDGRYAIGVAVPILEFRRSFGGLLTGGDRPVNGDVLGVVAVAIDLRGVCEVQQKPGQSEEHTSELQSRFELVCRLLLEKKNTTEKFYTFTR